MKKEKNASELNIFVQCKKLGLPLRECPYFIFALMGAVIIIISITTFGVGSKYIEDPLTVSLIVLVASGFLFVLSFIITKSFERLAEASRMKLEFLTIISHQMRAPFSNLRWVIELMRSGKAGKVSKQHEEYLSILKENSERMEELIERLITVSKIEQKMLPMRKEPFAIKDLIDKSVLEFKAFAEASNIDVVLEVEENLPTIIGDITQMREVIDNLLDNAIKYTKGNGTVVIKTQKRKETVYFEIKDTGTGIPKDDQKYIFQKFFRSENALKNQTQGTGLGLFIVKSIIESHGGKIGFKSEEEKGTTFWFTLLLK